MVLWVIIFFCGGGDENSRKPDDLAPPGTGWFFLVVASIASYTKALARAVREDGPSGSRKFCQSEVLVSSCCSFLDSGFFPVFQFPSFPCAAVFGLGPGADVRFSRYKNADS